MEKELINVANVEILENGPYVKLRMGCISIL